jgi:hypothetical protein
VEEQVRPFLRRNFAIGEKRRVQFRVDALNVFSHPTFVVGPNNGSGADFRGAPSTAPLGTTAYNTWAAFNGPPLRSMPSGAAIHNGIVSIVNA